MTVDVKITDTELVKEKSGGQFTMYVVLVTIEEAVKVTTTEVIETLDEQGRVRTISRAVSQMRDARENLRDHYAEREREAFGGADAAAAAATVANVAAAAAGGGGSAGATGTLQLPRPQLDRAHTSPEDRVGLRRRTIETRKRFNDFYALHKLWARKFPDIYTKHSSDLQLPSKTYWNRFKPSVIRERKFSLEQYMHKMLMIPVLRRELYVFLEIPSELHDRLTPLEVEKMKLLENPNRHDVLPQLEKPSIHNLHKHYLHGPDGKKSSVFDRRANKRPLLQAPLPPKPPRGPLNTAELGGVGDTVKLPNAPTDIHAEARRAALSAAGLDDERKLGKFAQFPMIVAACTGDLDLVRAANDEGVTVDEGLGYLQGTCLQWAASRLREKIEFVDNVMDMSNAPDDEYGAAERPIVPPIARRIGALPFHNALSEAQRQELARQVEAERRAESRELLLRRVREETRALEAAVAAAEGRGAEVKTSESGDDEEEDEDEDGSSSEASESGSEASGDEQTESAASASEDESAASAKAKA
jgi:hypothetical protein